MEDFATLSQKKLWADGSNRKAKIVSVLPQLDPRDRQVKLLLVIEDPLLLSNQDADNSNLPPVFINDFLNVELKGRKINNAWTIKNHWLQADNTIWVVDTNNTLQKRPVAILFKGRDLIYVDADIQKGDRALSEKPGIATIGLPVFPKDPSKPPVRRVDPGDFIKNDKADRERKRKEKLRREKKGRSKGDRG